MDEKRRAFQERTRRFALDVIRLVESLPRCQTANVLGRQLLRSSTSVAANYRAACRARTDAECLAKLGIVEEEADESVFWLEMIRDTHLAKADALAPLTDEGNQIVAIVVTSIKNLRKRLHAK